MAGFYFFQVQAVLGVAGAGTNEAGTVHIYKNGTAYRTSQKDNGSGNSDKLIKPGVAALIQLAANDYVEGYATMQGSRNIQGSQTETFFDGFLVSRT